MPYKDKAIQAQAVRRHLEENREVYLQNRRVIIQRNKDYVREYLETHPCVDCGESDPIVLEFDHVRGNKVADVSTGVKNKWKIEKLQEEISKCDVRCANCHRRVTHQRRQSKN